MIIQEGRRMEKRVDGYALKERGRREGEWIDGAMDRLKSGAWMDED